MVACGGRGDGGPRRPPPAIHRSRLLPGLEFSIEAVFNAVKNGDATRHYVYRTSSNFLTEQTASLAGRLGISRPFRVLALALAGTLVISAVLVIPGWIPILPRPIRRELTESLLQTVLAAYSVLVFVALVGTEILGGLWARSFRDRTPRPRIARFFLASSSCLVSLLLLEFGAAGWRVRMHRFPSLPTQFAISRPDE